MYADIIRAGRVHYQKMGFLEEQLNMAWKKMQVRGPKARYKYVEKFRVIIDAP
jgi:hypothetical protein